MENMKQAYRLKPINLDEIRKKAIADIKEKLKNPRIFAPVNTKNMMSQIG